MASLETLVQQQAALIQTLQARLGAVENQVHTEVSKNEAQATEIAALKSRLSSLSQAVGFTANSASEDITFGAHGVLKFDHLVTSVGGGYDPHTGIFTAPVSGLYVFFLSIMSSNEHGAVDVAIVKEGAALDRAWAEGQGDSYDQGSSLVTVHVTTGQKVWVEQAAGDTTVMGGPRSVFSGYLLQAD
nr:hypothetical protein BaRGS_031589 [Batillaria attramentaria]